MVNVLVFPCGSEISMEIFQSLKYVRFINLFGGSDSDRSIVRDLGTIQS